MANETGLSEEMPDGSLECHLGLLIAKTDLLLEEQERQREKLEQLSHDIEELKRLRWRFDGGATVAAWVGGAVLTVLISVGAWVLKWATDPGGPLNR